MSEQGTTAREVLGLATLICERCGSSQTVHGAREHVKVCRGGKKRKEKQCALCRQAFWRVVTEPRIRQGELRDVQVKKPWSGKEIAQHKRDHIFDGDAKEATS